MINPKNLLLRNVFSNWMGMLVSMGIAFFISPFLVHNLGKEVYGIWALVLSVVAYNRFFDAYAEKDVVNLVRATRNHACIVMWSSGNEVPDQWGAEGVKRAKWLQDIFHREDPTRPVTVGMDQVQATMASGFKELDPVGSLLSGIPKRITAGRPSFSSSLHSLTVFSIDI